MCKSDIKKLSRMGLKCDFPCGGYVVATGSETISSPAHDARTIIYISKPILRNLKFFCKGRVSATG